MRRKAFTLMELVVVVIVLGVLATFAVIGYQGVIDKGVEHKQMNRTAQVLREARALFLQRSTSEITYTWEQAVADAVDDLPGYQANALSDGAEAAGGTPLNTGANGWTVTSDTGSSVYSASPNDIVVKVSNDTVYIASAASSSAAVRGVFGFISRTGAPRVWAAACAGSSCDAESATAGPPAGGAYAAGTTTSTTAVAATTTTTTPATTTTVPVGSVIPSGVLVWFAGSTAPSGWLVADGSNVSRTTYSSLFAELGTTYGAGDGASTFSLPDMRGRLAVAQDATQTEFDVLGETGGAKSVTLTTAQLPAHDHPVSMTASGQANEDPFSSFMRNVGANGTWLAGNHMPGYGPTGWYQDPVYPSYPQHYHSFSLTSTASTSSTGAGGAHSNLQPYIALTPLVATGSSSRVEAGMIVAATGSTTPSGWLLADGSNVSRATYSAPFAAFGTTYGAGDGASTFSLPDLRGRAVVGRDTSQTEFDVLGETGGAKALALTSAEMPSHAHSVTLTMSGNTTDGASSTGYRIVGQIGTGMHYGHFAGWTGGNYADAWGGSYPQHYHSITLSGSATSGQAGSGSAHNELQPYRVVRYLVASGTSSKIEQGMLLMSASSSSLGGDFTADFTGGATPVGMDTSQTEFDTLAETGGTKTETLSGAQMPAHAHTVSMTFSGYTSESATYSFLRIVEPVGVTIFGNHTLGYTSGGYSDAYNTYFTRHIHSASASASATSAQAGSGQSHENLQPYRVVKMWRYTNATQLAWMAPGAHDGGRNADDASVPTVWALDAVLAGALGAWWVEKRRAARRGRVTLGVVWTH